MRNHLMASIATKNKSEDRSKNEQFHSRQQKTKDSTANLFHSMNFISFKTKVEEIKISKITFSLENSILFELTKFFNKIKKIVPIAWFGIWTHIVTRISNQRKNIAINAKTVSNILCEKTTQTGRHQYHNFTIKCLKGKLMAFQKTKTVNEKPSDGEYRNKE